MDRRQIAGFGLKSRKTVPAKSPQSASISAKGNAVPLVAGMDALLAPRSVRG